jgi:mucin-19
MWEIAGAFAINLVDSQSLARVTGSASVTITAGGAVDLTSENDSESQAEALPVDEGAAGGSVGIGASVALNIVANRSLAEVSDGAVLTGAGDVTLDARGDHTLSTAAEAGSAGASR